MIRGSAGRCPGCRWRVVHEERDPALHHLRSISRCHGGPPSDSTGRFPCCPAPPHDFCAAFEDAGSPHPDAEAWARGQAAHATKGGT